eukprot:CAMPEP_0171098376 /NCGR_PEP_ID=MMETSP0766_2-20121228/48082_1 /TAXON_ID=439317 /ORGANISM="Gambierdiscus australes, Strain CAWD 149" /LENGTH=77 /DNA_ID=CAMNT_0011557703 /DNA_START=137 /DNA_END=370 /DNA_ORIENTATION=+
MIQVPDKLVGLQVIYLPCNSIRFLQSQLVRDTVRVPQNENNEETQGETGDDGHPLLEVDPYLQEVRDEEDDPANDEV